VDDVGDPELEQEYRLRNEKVKLAVVTVTADSLRSQVNVPGRRRDHVLRRAQRRIQDSRKAQRSATCSSDLDAIPRQGGGATRPTSNALYNDGIEQYSTPEQLRASHILLKTDGKDDAAVEARRPRTSQTGEGGADFAALREEVFRRREPARKTAATSTTSAAAGWCPEFDAARLRDGTGPDQRSGKDQYGYHIIKLVEKKAGTVRPLAEVRDQIADQLAFQRAQIRPPTSRRKMQRRISKPADLDSQPPPTASRFQESGFFARDEPILGLGANTRRVSSARSS
jgi:hypothetical protein